jgi:F-type H+-transporting ATPase subunit epsilon
VNEKKEARHECSTIRCDIVSAEEEIFHGEAELVVATGEMGELGIAPRHAPLITRLKPGKVVVTLPGGESSSSRLRRHPRGAAAGGDRAGRHRHARAGHRRGGRACKAKEEAERIIANRTEKMDIAEAQQKLAEVTAQLQALERLRKNLKH